MLTDGVLMRMGKEDFVELLKAPVLHNVDFAKAHEMVKTVPYCWMCASIANTGTPYAW